MKRPHQKTERLDCFIAAAEYSLSLASSLRCHHSKQICKYLTPLAQSLQVDGEADAEQREGWEFLYSLNRAKILKGVFGFMFRLSGMSCVYMQSLPELSS